MTEVTLKSETPLTEETKTEESSSTPEMPQIDEKVDAVLCFNKLEEGQKSMLFSTSTGIGEKDIELNKSSLADKEKDAIKELSKKFAGIAEKISVFRKNFDSKIKESMPDIIEGDLTMRNYIAYTFFITDKKTEWQKKEGYENIKVENCLLWHALIGSTPNMISNIDLPGGEIEKFANELAKGEINQSMIDKAKEKII